MIQPIGVEHFYHDGRGPELQRVRWASPGNHVLRAIEYFCPDDVYEEAHLRHVHFVRPQVFMFTPEEVIPYGSSFVVADLRPRIGPPQHSVWAFPERQLSVIPAASFALSPRPGSLLRRVWTFDVLRPPGARTFVSGPLQP